MNHSDLNRNAYMLCGAHAKRGYLRWWHSFSGINHETGQSRTFFVEYFIINPGLTKQKPGQPPKPSYVRVSAGMFPQDDLPGCQLHAYYPVSAAKFASNPLYFQVEDNILRENRIDGYIDVSQKQADQSFLASDCGTMEWNLEVHKSLACHTGIIGSPLASMLNVLDSFWHGEGIRTAYRGIVVINEETYDITPEACFGYADKHWGRSYNHPWLQLSSCSLRSERTGKLLKHSALAIDGCCPRFLCFRLKPQLMMQLTYTGEDFCYSFARPLSFSRLKWGTKETRRHFLWHLMAQNKNSLVKLNMHCKKQDMLTLLYDNPEGEEKLQAAPLWAGGNGVGSIDLYRITSSGKEWIDTLTIEHALCEFQKPPRRPHKQQGNQ